MLLILLCGFSIFIKLYFDISWMFAVIFSIGVVIVYIILDDVFIIGKYIILFGISIYIVYYLISTFI